MQTNFCLVVNGSATVLIDRAIQKPNGLVVTGKVIKGNISVKDTTSIKTNGKNPIVDEIVRIESYHEEILIASKNDEIGILLKNTSKEALIQYLR